ncbi:MAG: Ldh family oxidoreductase [Candidatus Latescibacteria bacterium]|nr:Ldh family oxidoreductase [Candidatus Latescibacterota bacterium]
MGTPRIEAGRLRDLVQAVFARCGMEDAAAALLADSLVEADLGGVHSHGVLRIPEYAEKLQGGGVDPRGRPRLVRQLRACRLAPGFERVYAPGEKEHLNRQAYLREGIPLTAPTLEGLIQTARELGLDIEAYRLNQ